MSDDSDEATTLCGYGVRLTGRRRKVVPMLAVVPMKTTHGLTGFKFQDTIATYRDEERDVLHPDGYGEITTDKYGHVYPGYSTVAGLIGGITEVTVYPEQFGIPCAPGTCFYFVARPSDFMRACADAVASELYPPEYVI